MANWVSTELVGERLLSARVQKLWYFTLLAKALISMKNYHGAMQVCFLFPFLLPFPLFDFFFPNFQKNRLWLV